MHDEVPQSVSWVQLAQRLRPLAHHIPVLDDDPLQTAGCVATHWVDGQLESLSLQDWPLFTPPAQTPVQFCPGTLGSQ
jgi:hypothetical protein